MGPPLWICSTQPLDLECMQVTCKVGVRMTKMVQVRHVPEAVHRALKSKAALAGMSLSDWLLVELELLANLPTEEEWLARLDAAEPFAMQESSAALIRKERDAA